MADETFEEAVKMEEHLEHHGVLNMRWGVWNDETKRKYGVLGSGKKKAAKTEASETKAPDKPKTSQAASPSLVERGVMAVKQHREAKNAAREAERQRIADEEAARKAKELEDQEFKSKYGMSREEYEELRQKTLDSHDPRVVVKGMHLLSDKELEEKLKRLEKEGKVKSIATKAKKEEAEAKKAEYERLKQTLPYRIGESAAKAVSKQVINNVTNNVVKPIASEVTKSLGDSGVKAINSLKKQVGGVRDDASKSVNDTKTAVKKEAESIKSSKSGTKSEIEAGYGKTIYDRMKGNK